MRGTNDCIKNILKKLKGKRGISIIALVVTIIVLLILLSISINVMMGDEGTFEHTKNAVTEQELAQLRHDALVAYVNIATVKGKRNVTVREIVDRLQRQNYTIREHINVNGRITGVSLSQSPIVMEKGESTTTSILIERENNKYYGVIRDNNYEIFINEKGEVDVSNTPETIIDDPQETPQDTITTNVKNTDIATASLTGEEIQVTGGNTEGTTELTLTVNGIDYRVAKIAVVSTDKVNYEVLHRKEEFDGTFTTEETELLLASVNETVTPETKTYEGFNSPEVQTVIVRDDRNTRIIYQYTRKSFELTLTKGNGVQSVSGAGTYKYEEPVTIGYTLEPGYDTARITGDVTERNFTMPAKNVQANIEGVEKEILITFVAGNGVNVDPSTKTVTFNGTYGELPSPNKTGYDFEGWYTGENGTGNKIQAEDKVSVTTNIELYAKWTAKEYQIALNAGNGANAGTTTIYELYEGKYSLTSNGEAMTSNANPITKPERNGYAFGGYYTSANGEGTKVIDENGYLVSNVSTSIFAENGTLYANWIQAAYQEYNGDVFVKYYYTLAEALSGVTSGNTITALVGTEETTAPTLAQDKTVTLNLNGKTITLKNTSLANNGALTITGAGTLTTSTANNLITNTGTLELAQSGTISNTNSGEYFTVRNTGTINVSGTGTVSSATEITNSDPSKAATIFGGNINVSNGTVLSTGSTPIVTSGTFNMTGGKVRTEKRYAVYIYGSGTATVSAGTIEKDKSAGNEWTSGACFQINNTATATLSGGTIKNYEGNGSNVIYNYSTGDIVVDGATIQNLGTSPAGTVAGTGKIIVESGVVTTTGADAIRIENAQSKVIIGKEGDTSTTSPEILGRIYGTAEGSQITVNSGKVMGTTHGGINTLGSVTVNGGEISIDKSKSTVSEPYTIAAWSNTSKIKITGGTISNSMAHTVVTGADVTGEIEITGGTITSTTHPAVQGNKANITISGSPVITGETRGVSTVTGTITITGGTISATNGVGVVVSTGTVTIGTNEQTPNVSTETPNITGSIYGVQVENGGTFNFYDGVIRGATNKAMLRAPIGKPEGYEVYKTNANGIETAILARTVTISLNNQDATTAGTNEIYEVYGIAYLLTNNGEVMSTEANPITKPEKENYLFDGYYTQTNGQGTKIIDENGYLVSGVSTTQFNSNSTIYAKWKDIIYAEYNGNNLVNTYNTLSEAFTGVTSGNTIKAINGNEETVAPTLASGKTVTLDLNGKTITLTNVTLTNNGNLTITGNGTLTTSTANDLITNAGTLNLAQTGTVSNTSTERISVVRSTGTTNITGTGNIESKTDTYAIYGGNINISNGTITTEDGGVYTKNTFNMTDGKIHSSTCAVLISNGTATISGGIIEKDKDSEGNWQVGACFNVSGNSNVTLSGGTIQGFDGNPSNSIMHDGTGSVIIDGATVLNSNNAITNGGSGKIIVKSGTVTSTRANGIRNSGASTGNIEIKGGTISSGGSATLRNEGTGTIIIGEENSDSIESPIINGRVFGNGENIGDIIVHSGKILGTSAEGIASSGNIIINGGLISTLENGTNGVILNSSTGKITITGGTIQSKDYMAVVVKNTETGEVEITGGTITSTQSEAIYNAKGKTTISGNPTITGKNGIDIRTGEGIITGGTISGTNGYGVSATTGTVTIGTNESPVSVSTEVPSITGTTYGVQVTEGTLNFYDGVIKGAANQAISGTVVAKPEGYEVYKTTENNIETAVLSRVNTITFNSNDGTFENSETTNVVKFVGTNVIEGTYKVPTKENYSFINWNTQANGTGTSYTLQDLNTLTQDITLYAQFKQVTLVTGPNFNKTIKELNSHETEDTTIKSIIFKKTSDLTGAEQTAIANTANDKIFNVDLDNEGLIKTYKTGDSTNGYTVYVVSDYDIYANASSEHMFRGIQVATSITFDNFNTSNVTNMSYMFYNCKGLTSLNVNNFDTTSVINMSYMFGACAALTSLDVSNFETSNVNSMFGMFDKCKILTSININTNKFNTSNVTTMGYMFNYCQKLTNLDVSEFDTSKVKNMSFMFNGCNELTSIEVRNFDTSNVIYMENMFCGDYKLANLDVSKFITSNVTNMSKMFFECYALTSLDVSEFDTSKVTNMQCMFYSCRSLTSLDVSHFNTSNVENMGCMFYNCNSLTTLDVSSFNTSNVTNMYRMFAVNDTLTTIYASNNFNTDKYLKSTNVDGNEVNNTNMFDISTRLVGGSGTVFDANHIDKTYAHIDGGVSNPGYFHNAPVTITFNSNDGTFENNETTNVIKMSGTNVIQGTYKVPTKAGYEFLSWNTQADGTGTSYTSENLNTITEATTLYAQWTKIYSISYNLDGGTVSTANPTSYTKESNTITLNNPTKNGYKFTGWTETIKDFTWNEGFINLTTGAIETSTTYPDSHYTDFIRLKAGVTYTLSGQGDYGTTNLRWRIYNLDGTYRNGGDNGGSYTLASDGYLRLLYFASSTEEQRNNSTLTVEPNETVTIPQGSTGNREYTANWLEAKTTFNFYYNGGALPSEYQEVEYIESTKAGAQYFDTEVPGNNNNLGFEIQYSLGSIPTTWSTIFGSYTNEATNATRLLLNGGADRTYYNINSKAGGGSYSVAINKTINTIYTESIKPSSETTFTFTSNAYSGEQTPVKRINGNEQNNTIKLFSSAQDLKVYYFKIYDGDTLIRYYVPCIHEENNTIVAGMYDKVTGEFKKSARATGFLYAEPHAEVTQEFSYGETKKLTKNSFERQGFTFTGWNTKSDGTGTRYEDEETYTNSTLDEVTINLYAQWQDTTNPSLTLSKETYQEGFNDWELTGGAYIDNEGVLILPNSNSEALSRFYQADEFWHPAFDVYTENPVTEWTPKGGWYFDARYYNNEFTATENSAGLTSAGFGMPVDLNTWYDATDGVIWNLNQRDVTFYGDNIKYVRLNFRNTSNFSVFPSKIRNFKIYGQQWQAFYNINLTAIDNETGIKVKKYALGNHDTSYFSTNGTEFTGSTIRVTESGVYTVYVEDNGGNKTVQTIEITRIDKTAPTNTKPEYTQILDGLTITNKQVDNESGLQKVQYAIKKSGENYGEWQDNNTFTSLKHNTTYFIKTRSLNKAGVSTESAEEELFTDWITAQATFLPGEEMNIKMKTLAGDTNPNHETDNTTIKGVRRSNTIDNQYKTTEHIVSTNDSESPIYMWFDDTDDTIYWYTEDTKPSINPNATRMFKKLKGITSLDASDFDTSNVTTMMSMFNECSSLTSLDVSHFDTSKVTDMKYMFLKCSALTSLDVSHFDTSKVTTMAAMFQQCNALTSLNVSLFDTPKVTDMSYMFYYCNLLTSLDVSHFNTSNVTNFAGMFEECNLVTSLDVSHFDTIKATDISFMFLGCSALTSLNVSHFETTNVVAMNGMFASCSSLTSLDVSHFDTSNAVNMNGMFGSCTALTSLDVSHFNTTKVTDMSYMFYKCTALTSLDVSHFNTSNVENMGAMFTNCSTLTNIDVSNFNTSNVTNMYMMFANNSALTTIYASNNFNTDKYLKSTERAGVEYNHTQMFNNSTALVGGNGTVYDANHIDKAYAHIDGGTSNPGYFHAKPVTITFDSNTGIFDNSETTNVVKMSGINAVEGTYKVPTKANYSFINWNTAANGTGTSYKLE
ncbi:MAG: BspA family leucine-rich repeat surface protein, partial [Clostridia bacterium]|nr:BspA family leucine-rich repeat surface protein [Clostridia bacterium]